MWGAAPHPARVGIYMRGFTPRPNHEEIYMDIYGASPMPQSRRWYGHRPYPDRGGINPTSRSYFGKKNPKDPKKPNYIGFRLSSIDSEQGCRRQPCFLFGADSTAPQPPRRPDAPRARRATPHPPSFAPPFLPRSLCAPHICTARARTAPCPRRAPPTHPYHSPASPRVPVAHPAALTHLPAVPIAPAAHTPPCSLVHPAHRPHLNSLVHPTKVLKLRTFSF